MMNEWTTDGLDKPPMKERQIVQKIVPSKNTGEAERSEGAMIRLTTKYAHAWLISITMSESKIDYFDSFFFLINWLAKKRKSIIT